MRDKFFLFSMGMYDTLQVEEGVDLPGFEGDNPSEITWQTKDLKCLMDHYKITTDGKLLVKRREVEEKSEEELDKEAQEHGYSSFDDMMKEGALEAFRISRGEVKDKWWEDVEYHGAIKFYASKNSPQNDLSKRYEYQVVFKNGVLDDLFLLDKKS